MSEPPEEHCKESVPESPDPTPKGDVAVHRSVRGGLRLAIPARTGRDRGSPSPEPIVEPAAASRIPAPSTSVSQLPTTTGETQRHPTQVVSPRRDKGKSRAKDQIGWAPKQALSSTSPSGSQPNALGIIHGGDATFETTRSPEAKEVDEQHERVLSDLKILAKTPTASSGAIAEESPNPFKTGKGVHTWSGLYDYIQAKERANVAAENRDIGHSEYLEILARPLKERSASLDNIPGGLRTLEEQAGVKPPPQPASVATEPQSGKSEHIEHASTEPISTAEQRLAQNGQSNGYFTESTGIDGEKPKVEKARLKLVTEPLEEIAEEVEGEEIEEGKPILDAGDTLPPFPHKECPCGSTAVGDCQHSSSKHRRRKWSKFSWTITGKGRSGEVSREQSRDESHSPKDETEPTEQWNTETLVQQRSNEPVSASTGGPSRRQSSRSSLGSIWRSIAPSRWSRSSSLDDVPDLTDASNQLGSNTKVRYVSKFTEHLDSDEEERKKHFGKLRNMARKIVGGSKKPHLESLESSSECPILAKSIQATRAERDVPPEWTEEEQLPHTEPASTTEQVTSSAPEPSSHCKKPASTLGKKDLSKLRDRHSIENKGGQYTVTFPLSRKRVEEAIHPAFRTSNERQEWSLGQRLEFNRRCFEYFARGNLEDPIRAHETLLQRFSMFEKHGGNSVKIGRGVKPASI